MQITPLNIIKIEIMILLGLNYMYISPHIRAPITNLNVYFHVMFGLSVSSHYLWNIVLKSTQNSFLFILNIYMSNIYVVRTIHVFYRYRYISNMSLTSTQKIDWNKITIFTIQIYLYLLYKKINVYVVKNVHIHNIHYTNCICMEKVHDG